MHGVLPDIEPCDLFILAGDFFPTVDHSVPYQAKWLTNTFIPWWDNLLFEDGIICSGNHDRLCYERGEGVRRLVSGYHQDELWKPDYYEHKDYPRIYMTPRSPLFGHINAFMLPDDQLAEKFALIPEGLDILVSHGPPYGHCDRTVDGEHVGSRSLLYRVMEVQPSILICGHIHEGYGKSQIGKTTVYNVSRANEKYEMVNPPLVLEMEHKWTVNSSTM